jgi:hypothetical protein
MKKTFVCLANSKKYSGRCIAGIELQPKPGGGWRMLRNEAGRPKWIRPVSYAGYGQIEEAVVKNIRLLDVMDFEMTGICPQGYQSENVFFAQNSLMKVAEMPRLPALLDVLTEDCSAGIFGNSGKLVSAEDIGNLTCSLVIARIEKIEIYYPVVYKTFNPRAKIHCGGHLYDLPVTDLQTIVELQENPKLLENRSPIYATFSLGRAFEGAYYKIAAGLIYV